MGIRLIAEVLDSAPETLTYRELYVLLVLAENARDSTRQCWPGVEDNPDVVRRLRMGRSQRYGAIKALVEKGALVRVRRGQKHVRAVYGIPRLTAQGPENPDPEKGVSVPETGTLSESQRPETRDPERDVSVRETGTLSESQRPGFESSASGFSSLSVRKTRTPSPQSPQDSSSPRARVARTLRAAGVTEDEMPRVIEIIEARYQPRDLSAYVRTLVERGDLAGILAEMRAEQDAAERAQARAALREQIERAERDGPHCQHGTPGGAFIRPDTGLPHCAICRALAAS